MPSVYQQQQGRAAWELCRRWGTTEGEGVEGEASLAQFHFINICVSLYFNFRVQRDLI